MLYSSLRLRNFQYYWQYCSLRASYFLVAVVLVVVVVAAAVVTAPCYGKRVGTITMRSISERALVED